MLVVAPICLTHEEIKEADDQDLLFAQSHDFESTEEARPEQLALRGLPIDCKEFVPLMFMVPNFVQQNFHYSVSFLNISNILCSLLIAAWTDREDLRQEVNKNSVRESNLLRSTLMGPDSSSPTSSEGNSPVRLSSNASKPTNSLCFTTTTISPKNTFKKISAPARDKPLETATCNWQRAFQNVRKHKLFSLKHTSNVRLAPDLTH